MNELQKILQVVSELEASGVETLLVGGMAVNHYGYTRNTLDVDFLIASSALDTVKATFKALGYTNVAEHESVLFFNKPGSSFRVDFLKTDGATVAHLREKAMAVELSGCCVKVPALSDLLAMKFYSLKQAFSVRADKDLPDIAWLAIINGLDAEKDLYPLALRYANEDVYRAVLSKFDSLKMGSL